LELNFNGKSILITGGTHGIGKSTAILFSKLGGRVIVIGRNEENAKKLIEESNGDIQFIKSDLSSLESVKSLCERLDKEFTDVDVLINNASRNSRFSILDTNIGEWEEMLTLNLTATFLISKTVARNMIQRKVGGKIINVGAVQALMPIYSSFPYSVVKGGLISMTKSLAVDLSKFGIQAMYLMLGPIYAKPDSEEPPADFDNRAATLLGRSGRKHEVANLIVFLSSELNSFMTGNVIVLDGGRLISRKADPVEIEKNLFDSHH
jgi:NAD(P)-dependent dehydrogenase (short-subunit alcohol dehydrogenase family)